MATDIRFMKLIGLITLCGFIMSPCAISAPASNKHSLDKMVAIVNDAVITQSELDQAMNAIKKQSEAANAPIPSLSLLQKKALDQLIYRKLQLQLAEQNGLRINDTEVTKAINTIAETNKVTLAQLYQKIAEDGMSIADYRKEIREELTLQQIERQEVGSKISMTPQQVKEFMRSTSSQTASTNRSYRIEDILVALPDSPTPDNIANAKKQAQALLEKLHQGTTFENLSPDDYNDLGWRKLSEVPSAFTDHVAKAKTGSVIGPIQTDNGLHIVYVQAVRDDNNQAASFEAAQQQLYQQKFEEALHQWTAKLRSQAIIIINPQG
jgi:peptidyl-prolyl cis-trans isomerase SurA